MSFTEGGQILVFAGKPKGLDPINRVLRRAGFSVTEAHAGTDTLHQIRAGRPSLVLLDGAALDSSGPDLLPQIRRDPTLADVVVIVVGDPPEPADPSSLVADDYVDQSVSAKELLSRVRLHLRQRDLRLQIRAERRAVRFQQIVAQLGLEALRAAELGPFLQTAIRQVAEGLDVDFGLVLQLLPDLRRLRLVAGIGWRPGLVGAATVTSEATAQAGYTLNASAAVVVDNFARETRFAAPPWFEEHAIVSGASITITQRGQPWGVLGVHSTRERAFTADDLQFLQSVATMLSALLDRLELGHSLSNRERQLRDAQRIAHLGSWELDLATKELTWSEEIFRIFGVEPASFGGTYEAFLRAVHPDDRPRVETAQQAALSGDGVLDVEHRIVRPDGALRYVREKGTVIRTAEGTPMVLAGTVLDITDLHAERIRAEKAAEILSEAQRIANIGSWETDGGGNFVIWSEQMHRIHGTNPARYQPSHRSFTRHVHPADRDAVKKAFVASLNQPGHYTIHHRIKMRDGRMKDVEERWQTMSDSSGQPLRAIGSCRDVTESRRQERLLACEAAVLDGLSSGQPLARVLETLALGVEEIISGSLASVLVIDPEKRRLLHGAAPHLPADYCRAIDGLAIGPGVGSCGTAAYRGEAVIVTDIAADPLWTPYRELAKLHRLAACWSTPFLDPAGQPVATVAIYFREPRSPESYELETIKQVVRLAGLAIERERRQQRLHASEEQFRRTFADAATGIAVLTPEGRFVQANPAYCRMVGYAETELLGTEQRVLTHPDDREKNAGALRDLLLGGTDSFIQEKRYLCKNGSVVWGRISVSVIRDAHGHPLNIVGVAEDISEQKRATERVLRLNRVHALLSGINSAIVSVRDRAQLFERACGIAVEIGGLQAAWVGIVDSASGCVTPVAHAGDVRGYLDEIKITTGPAAEGRGPFGRALRENRPVIANDLERDPSFAPWRDAASARGFRAVAVFPLYLGGRAFGAYVLYAGSVDFFDEEEVKLLTELAADISFSVAFIDQEQRRAIAETGLRESEARFRAIFEQAAVGICEVALDYRFLRVNARFCEIIGFTADELLGYGSCVDSTHPDDKAADAAATARLVAGEVESVALEKRYVRKDGGIVWAHLTLSLVHSASGEPLHYIGVISDITARKLAEQARDRIFNFSVDLLSVASLDGDLEQVNPAWTAVLGWTAEELTSRPVLDFVHPDDHEATLRSRERLLAGEKVLDFDNRYRGKDGTYRWLSWNVHPLPGEGRIFSVARDITAQRAAQQHLQLLETCVARLNDIVLITDAEPFDEPGPRIVYVNDAFTRLTGFTREETIGKTPRMLQSPKTQRETLDRIRAALTAWKPVREELINYTKAGEEIWLELDIVPVADAKGWFTHWIAVERDITERKRSEAALAESRRQYRDLVENSHDLIWSFDAEGTIQFMNRAAGPIFGRAPEEMIGRSFRDFLPPEQLARDTAAFVAAVTDGREEIGYLTRVYRKDGTLIDLSVNSRILRDADGRVIGGTCNGRDVSATLRAQEAFQRQERLLRIAGSVAQLGGWSLEVEQRRLQWSEEIFAIHDLPPGAQPTFEQAISYFPATSRARVDLVLAACIERGEPFDVELELITAKGRKVWVRAIGQADRDHAGAVFRLQGALQDVSEQRAVREKIQEAQALQRTAGAIARIGGWAVSVPEHELHWSDEIFEIVDWPPGPVPPLETALSFYPEPWRSRLGEAIVRCETDGTPFDLELTVVTPKARSLWARCKGEAERNELGAIVRVRGAFQDISERKHAELALVESEGRLRLAMDAARMGTFEWDVVRNTRRWSGAHEALWGYAPGEFDGTFQGLIGRIHPDDRPVLEQALGIFPGSADAERVAEFRVVWPDGSVHWIVTVGELRRDDRGEPSLVYGVVLEITERKRAESELKRTAATLAQLVQLQQELAAVQDTGPEFFDLLAARMQHLTGAAGAAVKMVDGDRLVYRAASGRLANQIGSHVNRAGSIGELALTGGAVVSCADTELDARVDRAACREIDARSFIVAPLRIGGQPSGLLKIVYREPNAFGPLEERNLQLIAETLGILLQRQRAFELLKSSAVQYRLLFRNNPLPMWVYDLNSLRFLAVNLAAVKHYGFTEAEFLGMTIRDIRPPEDVPQLEQNVAAAASAGPSFGQWRHRLKDGSLIDVEISSDSLEFDGRPARLVMAHDVSERERAAQALRASEAEFRVLAELLPQIVWITLADGRNIYYNQHWVDYTGVSLEESLGAGGLKAVHPDDLQCVSDRWGVAISTFSNYTVECRLRRADGEYRWWLIRAEPQRNEAGEVLKWFGTCTDIHDLKMADLEISRANRALSLLSGVNETLLRADDEAGFIRQVCEIAVQRSGYQMAWVGYAEDDQARRIRTGACVGNSGDYLTELNLSWDENRLEGQGPAGRAVRSGEPAICADIETDEGFAPWRDKARRAGFRGVICLPLKTARQTLGILGLYSSAVIQAAPSELKLLREIADDVAFGIEHLRQSRDSQRLQASVLKVATAVSATTGAAFFEQLARNMADALGAQAGVVAEILPGTPHRARTVAVIVDGEHRPNFDYEVDGTPCEHLRNHEEAVFHRGVAAQFAASAKLAEIGAEAYVGRRLVNARGEKVGLLYVLFRAPLREPDLAVATLRIFAARAVAELDRKQTEARLREQAALLDRAQDAILVRDLDHTILYWNKSAERLYGWSAAEAVGRIKSDLLQTDPAAVGVAERELLAKGEWAGELVHARKDGESITVEARWTLMRDAEGIPQTVLAINTDVTQRKKLEAQFLRAQRMESIGTLAGGIAHDLNNVLAPIMMSIGLLQMTTKDKQSLEVLATIAASAKRGAEMVSQVLSFARGMEGRRIEVQVRHLIDDVAKIAHDTFPKAIQIETKLNPNLWVLAADPTQLHQVLLNLCVNARDALPNGGKISLSAKNLAVDAHYAGMNIEAKVGPYVKIDVEDNGTGIPRGIIDKIFDPFFTTKEIGKGTGLGLSTSLAIVKSHGGFIQVYSEPGAGTRFSINLPAQAAAIGRVEAVEETKLRRGNGETVMVIDDEASVREITKQTLQAFGYRVLLASDGADALVLFVAHRSEIAVVLTDMMMPVMDGPATIHALLLIDPTLRIIAASGISANGHVAKAANAGIKDFLPKPYTAETLLRALAKVLHGEK